jgi:hypothetical protein
LWCIRHARNYEKYAQNISQEILKRPVTRPRVNWRIILTFILKMCYEDLNLIFSGLGCVVMTSCRECGNEAVGLLGGDTFIHVSGFLDVLGCGRLFTLKGLTN